MKCEIIESSDGAGYYWRCGCYYIWECGCQMSAILLVDDYGNLVAV